MRVFSGTTLPICVIVFIPSAIFFTTELHWSSNVKFLSIKIPKYLAFSTWEIPVWLKTCSIEIEIFCCGGGRCFLFFIIIIFFKTVFEIYVRFRKFQLFFLTPCPITPKPVAISRASIAACDPPFPGREGVGGGWKMTWKRETQNLAIFVFFLQSDFFAHFCSYRTKTVSNR